MKKIKLLLGRILTFLLFSHNSDNKSFDENDRLEIITGLEPLSQTENLADAELDWNKKVNELLKQFKQSDLNSFLSWDVIRKTMFIEYESYVKKELDYLKKYPSLLLEESSFGTPTRLYYYPKSSANLIHHNYHVARILNHFGIKLNDLNQVLEFGGGYGSMARVFYKLGYTEKYAIYDFSAFNSLQKFYLRNVVFGDLTSLEKNVSFLTEFEHLNRVNDEEGTKLFLATWSISETSLEFREQFLSSLGVFDYYLIAFQHKFQNVDNKKFFQQWSDSLSQAIEWNFSLLPHIGEHSYLFGRRK